SKYSGNGLICQQGLYKSELFVLGQTNLWIET
ncbi:MAG: hypothetical protein ACI9Z7_001993, partial [Alteromonas macleodii]